MLNIQKKLSGSFLGLLSLPATAVGFALSTQIAALSWLLSTRFGLDIHDVALVWLAGPMAGIIGQPIVGAISDDAWFLGGRRKPFILIGGVLGALMFLALPEIGVISTALGFEGVIVIATIIALLLDLSINVTFNPARSIIADLTPEGKKRTSGFTIMQLVSGFFGLLAYFISIVLGNITLIYIAVFLVLAFSVIPCFFIEEDKNMNVGSEDEVKTKTGIAQIFKIIYPLSGFLLFAVYLIIDKLIVHGKWESAQVNVMYACLGLTLLLGIGVILKGFKKQSNENEFHKIMVAHSFSWLGIQSMFVMSFFFAKEIIVPNLENSAIANSFTTFFTGKIPSADDTAGNILSLAFLLFNAVGAFFPVLVLEPMAKSLGRVKTYFISILIMSMAYLFVWKLGHTETSFYLGICLAGIGWSAVISIVFAIMSERVDKKKMGLNMGLFNYSVVLPQMMTVGVAAMVKDSGDYSMLYLVCGISLFISFVFWLFVKEPESTGESSSIPTGGGH
ncbi:MAG: MFS transporter [Flavobacteriales bacterium]|nr:MFS transporter [Flavobacteriales bacterium]